MCQLLRRLPSERTGDPYACLVASSCSDDVLTLESSYQIDGILGKKILHKQETKNLGAIKNNTFGKPTRMV